MVRRSWLIYFYSIRKETEIIEKVHKRANKLIISLTSGYATWFTAEGAIRIALRQLWQTWKLHHYDVIDDVITRKL